MNISNDAQKVIDNAGAGAMDYINNSGVSWGDNLTSGEANSILANGFDPANVTADTQAPTDLMGIQSQINDKYGVTEAQKAVDDTQAKLRNVNINVDDPISMSKLVGQRGKATDALQNQLQGQVDVLSAAQSQANQEFQIAQDEWNKIENLMLTAPGAGITYADTFESAVGKYNNWLQDEEEKAKKAAEKAAKDGNYDQMFAMYGTTADARPKGMSKKEYLKWLEKEYGDVATSSSGYNERSTSWKPTGGSGGGSGGYLGHGAVVNRLKLADGSTQILFEDGTEITQAPNDAIISDDTGGNNSYGASNMIGDSTQYVTDKIVNAPTNIKDKFQQKWNWFTGK